MKIGRPSSSGTNKIKSFDGGWCLFLDPLCLANVLSGRLAPLGVLPQTTFLDEGLYCILEVDAIFSDMVVASM